MIFLSNEKLKQSDPMTRRGSNYRTDVLARRSEELRYLYDGALIGEFNGVNAFIKYNQEFCKSAQHSKASSKGRESGFTVFNSYKEAEDVFLTNPQSIRHFEEKDELLDGGEDSGKTVEYDLTGDYIDIDRFIEGVPEVFGQMTNGNPRARRVWIVFNEGWLSHASDTAINTRSARIARLVDWLESQGVRCQVTAIASNECGHQEIRVKEFDEPLDLNDVAVVSHSDFHRRQVFRHREYSETYDSGYGSSRDFSAAVKKDSFTPQFNTEYSVWIDSVIDDPDEINADFDSLEGWLADVLTDDTLEADKRSIAILR